MIENSDIGCHKSILESLAMSKLEGMPGKICTADEFTGKKVVDREGIAYGKVKHIHIHPETMTVSGVTIHEGFNNDYFLSSEYIDKFTEKSLLLNIPPIRPNAQVVDIDGRKIGTVKRLQRNPQTYELESLEIAIGFMKTKIVSKSHVWGVGEKIILHMTKDEFKNLK
jgi:sporulation protein YlmC with PRC-barrel domain